MANVNVRARKQEEAYKWWAIIVTTSFAITLLINWLTPNAWVLSITILALAATVFKFTRTTRDWEFGDAITATRAAELRAPAGRELNPHRDNCQVIVHGTYFLVSYMAEAVTYTVDPARKCVIARRVRDPDSMLEEAERSEILRGNLSHRVVKQATDKAYEEMGFEKEDPDENNTST